MGRLTIKVIVISTLASTLSILATMPTYGASNSLIWSQSTPFNTTVSLYSAKYGHIHSVHGLDMGSGTSALRAVLANAYQDEPLYDARGNPTGYEYVGTLYYTGDATVLQRVEVRTGLNQKINTAFPTKVGSNPPPNIKYGTKTQFAYWVNDNGWSTVIKNYQLHQ